MKENKRWPKKKIMLYSFLGAAVIGLGIALFNYRTFLNYKRDVAAIKVQNVDLNTIADGEYFGDCSVDLVRANVRVVIRGHAITELELLEHYNDRGEAANVIPGNIIAEQRIDVDAVTGATSSSRVIQEAVYNALTGERTIRRDR